jgi:hypothetical protein
MGRHCNSPSARVTRSVGASYQTPRLGACGSVLWLPVSAIFLADVVSLPVGTGGSGVRGERRGWAGTPRTPHFQFRSEFAAAISFNRQRALGTYTEVQWSVTLSASYRSIVRLAARHPSPRQGSPPTGFPLTVAVPHPPDVHRPAGLPDNERQLRNPGRAHRSGFSFLCPCPIVHGRHEATARHRDRLPNVLQSSSASRLTAGAAGFLTLIQSADRPLRYFDPSRFDTIPSQPSLQW